MLYTEQYVREKYTKYNNELFGGKLPPFDSLEFHITNKRNPWGRGGVTGYVKAYENGKLTYKPQQGYLELSNYYDNTEDWKDNVMVHEMVHIYEFMVENQYVIKAKLAGKYTKEFPRHGHGYIFYREAARLKPLGFDITRFVSNEEFQSATLSDENKAKLLAKDKEGVTMIMGSYATPTDKGYHTMFVKLLTPSALQSWQNSIRNTQYYAKHFSFIGIYKASNLDEVAKISRSKVDHWHASSKTLDVLAQQFGATLKSTLIDNGQFIGDTSHLVDISDFKKCLNRELFDKIAMKAYDLTYWDDDNYREGMHTGSFNYKLANGKKIIIKITPNGSEGFDGNVLTLVYDDYYDASDASAYYDEVEQQERAVELAKTKVYDAIERQEKWRNATNPTVKVGTSQQPQMPTQPQQPAEQRIPIFRMNIVKSDGSTSTVEFRNVTKEELKEKLRQRFPKWPDASIERTMNNEKHYPLHESVIEKLIRETVREYFDDKMTTDKIRKKDNLPDTLGPIICDN